MLIAGEQHLRAALSEYVKHHNEFYARIGPVPGP